MNENKTKKPILLSMPVIILVSVLTLTILSPVSLILSIIRFKKYPELKNKNIVCLGISGVMVIALIMFLCMPGSDKEDTVADVPATETIEETTAVEEQTTEAKTEETVAEETTEDTGIYGYPEQEKELTNAGVDISNIPSRECFLYTYAEYKALVDYASMQTMDDITVAVWDYVSDADSMSDYEIIDTMAFSYRGENLADYFPDYLIPLVGDECNDVMDTAMNTYFGYTPDDEITSTNVAIDYIEALENKDSYKLFVTNHGSKTKDEIYTAASEIASNVSSTQFNNYSKDFIRNLDSNVGQPIVYTGGVASVIDNYAEVMFIPEYYGEGETSTVDIDLSCLSDTTLLQQDNVTVYGVYLGLNQSNTPIILALSINFN